MDSGATNREQAHSYIWNAFPCRSEPARDRDDTVSAQTQIASHNG